MARIQPAQYDEEPGGDPGRGRKAARYAVPVAVAGLAAATISLVPALADTGNPSLPPITAEQLLAKVAGSDTQALDGTVKFTADLGLPAGLAGGSAGGLLAGAAPGGAGADKGSPAAPQAQLAQLLAGTHTLHVAVDGQDRQKVSIIETAAEYSLIHNGAQLWAYDSASDQAYHQTLPQDASRHADGRGQALPDGVPTTPQAAARQILDAAQGTAAITVDGTARVAGHSAYELLATPQHADATTVGSVRIAVDAKTGVPLRFTLAPKGGGKAVFDIGFTRVGFGRPAAGAFAFTPPKGVKVTEGAAAPSAGDGRGPGGQDTARGGGDRPTVLGRGWDSIAVLTSPGGLADKTGKSGASGAAGAAGAENRGGKGGAGSLLDSFGTRVDGAFGAGTLFHTRLVNALLTDKGALYVGAVTQSALTDAANAAAR